MNKYMLLYLGPAAADVGLDRPPLTQTGLTQWAQRIGASLVDRGNLFGITGTSIVDNGTLDAGPPPLHGYSIVQAQNLTEVSALVQGHPFLSNGGQGNFEIQVIDLTDGERPLAVVPAITMPGPIPAIAAPAAQAAQQAPNTAPDANIVQPTAPNTNSELNVPHEADQPPQNNYSGGQQQPPRL